MTLMQIINALLCAACCGRLILFARDGTTHRPLAAALAYALIVACAAIVVATLFGRPPSIDWSQLLLNAVLTAAVFSAGGNIVGVFWAINDDRPSLLLRLMRREKWI